MTIRAGSTETASIRALARMRRTIFGQCSGRRACKCKPLTRPECENDTNCEKGEKCVTYLDADTESFCMWAKAMDVDPFIYKNGDAKVMNRVLPTPIRLGMSNVLTEDACLTNSDCVGKRRCFRGITCRTCHQRSGMTCWTCHCH